MPGSTGTTVQILHQRQGRRHPRRSAAGAGPPTSSTTRRRRSRSTCAPRPGAGSRPRRSGPPAGAVIDELIDVNALHRLRSAQGIIGLAARPGVGRRLEAACDRALAVGDPSYRTIKGILAAGTEAPPRAHASRSNRRHARHHRRRPHSCAARRALRRTHPRARRWPGRR